MIEIRCIPWLYAPLQRQQDRLRKLKDSLCSTIGNTAELIVRN
jgi:hypothetical protein